MDRYAEHHNDYLDVCLSEVLYPKRYNDLSHNGTGSKHYAAEIH